VLAFEHAVAGPLCTKELLELGADVIKIESPARGDMARHYDDFVNGDSSHFAWLNRGKQSLAIDIRHAAGRAIIDRILADCDVVTANLSNSVLSRYLPDSELAKRYPGLIRCYVTGYGDRGPYVNRKAFDLLIQGEAGITTATGTRESPAKSGVSLVDLAAGTYAFGAICAALVRRLRDGAGCRIDVSLFDVATEWMMPLLLAYQFAGEDPAPRGLHHATIAPYGAYATSDGHLVNIAVQSDELARDSSLRSAAARYQQRHRIDEAVARVVARWPEVQLTQTLTKADIPWGLVRRISDVLDHPQLVDSPRWGTTALSSGEPVRMLKGPIAFDRHFGSAGNVPAHGEHTLRILGALGYTEEAIRRLVANGTVVCHRAGENALSRPMG
jgi:itaconate CoA-transferase